MSRADVVIEKIKQFVDLYLEYGRDYRHGSPLLANAIDPTNKEQAIYDSDDIKRRGQRLSNTASQSNLLHTLQGLTELTGEPRYMQRADHIRKFMFAHQADQNGLLYWGGHNAYLLDEGMSEYERQPKTVHELKFHFPDYASMWDVDPQATKQYIEAMWNAHVADWTQLDFNRHGSYNVKRGKLWKHEYAPGEVFFHGEGRTFVNAGSDLYYAAAMLTHLSGEQRPLEWAKHLAKRYIDTRQGNIGISGYQFSYRAGMPDRAERQIGPNIPPGHLVNEGTIFKPRPPAQRCQLQLFERLGKQGEPFLQWSISEMIAWGKVAYRKEDHTFKPMLTDGYPLEGVALAKGGYFGPQGRVFKRIPADEDFFWLYAYGFRLTKDEYLWQMASHIAEGLGMGKMGQPGSPFQLNKDAQVDHRALFGLIELYRATNDSHYLDDALMIGEQLLQETYHDGWFLDGDLSLANHPLPLALLFVIAEQERLSVQQETIFTYLPIHTRNMWHRIRGRRV